MSELDFACMELSIALNNRQAIERKLVSDKQKELRVRELWTELSKTSARKQRIAKSF